MIITINAHFHCCEHAMRDFSFMFFMVNQRMSRDHSLALAVHVCTAGRASSCNYKWFTARFFGGIKNCTRALKAIDKFLHMPVMCQLDFRTRMNEWILHVFQAIYRTSPIECFHMMSRRPYWCPQTMKQQPCWCPKPIFWELNFFLMQTLLLCNKFAYMLATWVKTLYNR